MSPFTGRKDFNPCSLYGAPSDRLDLELQLHPLVLHPVRKLGLRVSCLGSGFRELGCRVLGA